MHKQHFQLGGLLSSVLLGVALVGSCSLNSCRDKYSTEVQYDTVRISTPDWDDSGWVVVPSGTASDLTSIHFVNDSLGFVGGSNGTVIRTEDAGRNWRALQPTPLDNLDGGGTTNYGVWFFDHTTGVVIGDGLPVYHTSDGGQTWYGTPSNAQYALRSLYFTDRDHGFLGTSDRASVGSLGEILKTTDGGMTWTNVLNANAGIYAFSFASNGQTGVALGKYGAAFYTTDGGNSWQAGTTDISSQFYGAAFASPMTVYASAAGSATDGQLLRSTNGGRDWSTIKSVAYGGQGVSATSKTSGSTISMCGFDGHVLESNNSGASWVDSTVTSIRWQNIEYSSPVNCVMIGSAGKIAIRRQGD